VSEVLFAWQGTVSLALLEVFGDLGWLNPEILSLVDGSSLVRQACPGTHVDHWALRQIALVGEAAWCAARLWNNGVSLAIGGAELLGDALDIFPHTVEALVWWEDQMRPVVHRQTAMVGAGEVVEWSFPRTRSVR
jgi:2-polyprenyl-6-methoxyphenol hydroxylase-like FAD-dependent oxidoreductase